MIQALRTGRIRLIDGLIIAAVALLVLKTAGLLLSASESDLGPDGLPRFARVLAHARTNYVPPDPTTTGSVPEKKTVPPEAAPPPAEPAARAETPVPASPAERAIYERLSERREELQARARDLEARERLIEEEERKRDARADEARPAEAGRSGPAKAAEAEAAALKGLVTMYETMKPKEAARVFDRLPQDVLVSVVRQIAPRKMAEILAAMAPEKAEKLTIALARRPNEGGTPAPSGLPVGELPAIEPPARTAATPR